MPFLRFSRDKRGYETTSLVDAGRREERSRERILYWFRTPPGIKVGRPPLDETAIHFIEEHNPEIDFDWAQILETQPAAPPADESRGRRGRRDRDRPRMPGPPAVDGVTQPERPAPPSARVSFPEPESFEPEPVQREPSAPEASEQEFAEPERLEETLEAERTDSAPSEPEIAQAFEQLTHPEAEEKIDPPPTVVEHSLGREQLTRLRARYAELLARITERGGDPERVEALRAQAESLNPDTWVTSEEVRLGVESFEPKIRDLRAAVGLRRRRRSRRGGRRRRGAPPETASPDSLPPTESGALPDAIEAASDDEDDAD